MGCVMLVQTDLAHTYKQHLDVVLGVCFLWEGGKGGQKPRAAHGMALGLNGTAPRALAGTRKARYTHWKASLPYG